MVGPIGVMKLMDEAFVGDALKRRETLVSGEEKCLEPYFSVQFTSDGEDSFDVIGEENRADQRHLNRAVGFRPLLRPIKITFDLKDEDGAT